MKTKLFTLLFAVAASIGTMNAAIVNGTCGDNLTWSLNTKDSTLTIEGSGAMTNWWDGPVPWYEYRAYIKTVSLPDGLTSIGENAFYRCSALTSVTIPNSVTSIGGSAFMGCSKLTSVTIGNSVTSIGNQAFFGCCLTSVTIGNSVTSIETQAFAYCGLTSVTIPNSVTSIGNSAFEYCSSLTSVTIGNSVTSIGGSAFAECSINRLTVYATTPPTGGANCGINAGACTLYVPEESLETYANTLWWEDFKEIRSIGSFKIVKFVDWDGTVLSSAEVEEGSAATPPADPTRTGYTFIGWDKDFSNISEDLVVTAQYQINRYKVDFVDWDNTVLKTDNVDYNSAASAPEDPLREGYTFIGWDEDFTHVTEDLVVTAQYEIDMYPVIFIDYDGIILSEQSIAYNQAAMEPEVPAREGYTFIGWTADITHITARTLVIALYEKQDLLLVTYKKEDGEIISSENVDIHLPEAPIITGKTFAGWLTETADNTNGIVLRATYTIDNPTTSGDVVIDPSSTTAGVSFPYITGALTYVLVIRDLFGHVVCKIMFNANGQLLGIAFAPGRNNAPQQTQSEGFHFTVEGLTPGTTYAYEFVAHDETDQIIETLAGSFTTIGEATDVNNISSSSAPQKVINEGNVFILRGYKTYTITGAEVK